MKNGEVYDAQSRHGGRILIVDTEKDSVLKLKNMLVSSGYQVEVAYSAQSSLEKIETFEAEIALIGICPEQSDGIDLLARFKTVRPQMLCVMLTVCTSTRHWRRNC